MPEVAITRTDSIVVDKVGTNSYGDLTFTDKGGKEYKISNKRKVYFDEVVTPGAAVLLKYAMAYNKEYIHSAVPVELPPPVKPVSTLIKTVKNPEPIMSKGDWTEKDRITRRSIERQKSLELAVNLALEKIVTLDKIRQWAVKFENYLEKGGDKSENPLIEEAKKLGAEEIKEKGEH